MDGEIMLCNDIGIEGLRIRRATIQHSYAIGVAGDRQKVKQSGELAWSIASWHEDRDTAGIMVHRSQGLRGSRLDWGKCAAAIRQLQSKKSKG